MKATAGAARAAALVLASLAGCATTDTFSYLEGRRWHRAEMNAYDATIISVDGKHYLYQRPVRIDPGQRKIVVQGPPAAGFSYGEQRTIDMNVEPCKRYW